MARLRGSSDLYVFSQIFIEQEYSSLQNLENISLVLDLEAEAKTLAQAHAHHRS